MTAPQRPGRYQRFAQYVCRLSGHQRLGATPVVIDGRTVRICNSCGATL